MIEHTKGNILLANTRALVNPVNCVGVMGAGLALQYKQRFPALYEAYRRLAKNKIIQPGKVYLYDAGEKYVANFPTKLHWRDPSKMSYIDEGLQDLVKQLQARHIDSVAIPPLGCGLGGLDWEVVRPRIEMSFERLAIRAVLYAPFEDHTLPG